jgi:hypothetical protein
VSYVIVLKLLTNNYSKPDNERLTENVWEFLSILERLAYDAQMSAVVTENPIPSYLSPFTLALLEDTVRVVF